MGTWPGRQKRGEVSGSLLSQSARGGRVISLRRPHQEEALCWRAIEHYDKLLDCTKQNIEQPLLVVQQSPRGAQAPGTPFPISKNPRRLCKKGFKLPTLTNTGRTRSSLDIPLSREGNCRQGRPLQCSSAQTGRSTGKHKIWAPQPPTPATRARLRVSELGEGLPGEGSWGQDAKKGKDSTSTQLGAWPWHGSALSEI